MPYKVYISSTPDDLREYRAAVREVALKLDLLPVSDDEFGLAVSKDDQRYWKSRVMDADVFIGIYAYRYGQIVGDKSIIELEYEWARETGRICLLFRVHPDAPWPIPLVERGVGADKLEALKTRMAAAGALSAFMNMYDLKIQAFLGLHQIVEMLRHRDGMVMQRSVFGRPLDDPQFQSDFFMIMPFREQFEPVYRETIVPLITGMGATIKRGDDYFSQNAIIREVWSAIYAAHAYIAELTDRNANVFYELGIAHTLGKAGIMITQNIEDIPFDIRHLRFIVYENTPPGLARLRDELSAACRLLLAEKHG